MENNKLRYRYSIVRFTPNQLRGEFINIGIIMHSLETGELTSKWLPSLGRMRCLSNDITLDEYKRFQTYLGNKFIPTLFRHKNTTSEHITTSSPELLDYLRKEFHGQFRFSEPTFGLTDSLKRQIEFLYNTLVNPDFNEDEEEDEVDEEVNELKELVNVRAKVATLLRREKLLTQGLLTEKLPIEGKNHTWRFDFGYMGQQAIVVQVISLQQKSADKKSESALLLTGKVADVREKSRVEAYAVALQSDSADRMDGVTDALNLIRSKDIEIVPFYQAELIVNDLRRNLARDYNYRLFL